MFDSDDPAKLRAVIDDLRAENAYLRDALYGPALNPVIASLPAAIAAGLTATHRRFLAALLAQDRVTIDRLRYLTSLKAEASDNLIRVHISKMNHKMALLGAPRKSIERRGCFAVGLTPAARAWLAAKLQSAGTPIPGATR